MNFFLPTTALFHLKTNFSFFFLQVSERYDSTQYHDTLSTIHAASKHNFTKVLACKCFNAKYEKKRKKTSRKLSS